MARSALLRAFLRAYDAHFDEPFDGPEDTVLEALDIAEEDWDEDVLAAAFEEAGLEEAEDWPIAFWEELSLALGEV